MKKLVLGFVAAMCLVACGGSSDPCGTSKCSADPVPTADQTKACKDALAGTLPDGGTAKCTSQLKAYSDCAVANQTCGSDNKTDSAKITTACATQLTAYTTCLSMP